MAKQNVPKKFIIAEISLISASLIYIIIRLLTGKILPDSYIGENILSEIESSLTKLAVLSIPQFIFSLLLIVIPLTALIYSTIKSKRNGDFVVGYTPVISAVILAYGLAWSVFTVVSVYADDSSIIGSFKTLYLIREDEEENDTVTEEFIIFSTEKENSYTSSHRGYAQLRDESYYYLKCSDPDKENKFFPLSRSDYKRLSKVLNTHPNGEYSIIVTYHKKSGVINSYVFKDLTVGRDMEEYLYKKKTSENYTITLDEDLIVTRPAIKANSGICGWQIIRNGEMLKNEKDEKLPYTVSAENYTSINPQYYQYNDLPLILQSGEYEFRLVRAFKKENVLGGEPDYSVYNISNSVKFTVYDADIF